MVRPDSSIDPGAPFRFCNMFYKNPLQNLSEILLAYTWVGRKICPCLCYLELSNRTLNPDHSALWVFPYLWVYSLARAIDRFDVQM